MKLSKCIYVVWVLALFCAAMGLILSVGCSALTPVRSQTITIAAAQTNLIPVVSTAPVVTTNQVVRVTNGIAISQPLVITNLVTFTNFTSQFIPAVTFQSNYIAPEWFRGIEVLGAVTPFPWASTVATGLLALATTSLGYLNRRNAAKAAAALTALDEARIVGETLVDNFETLRSAALTIPAYQSVDHKVMTAVKLAQEIAGVKPIVAKLVDARTGDTV